MSVESWSLKFEPTVPIAIVVTVFVVATCGLVYELVAGALASYLLGDTVTQFSLVIGAYLFSMGIGSWLSRHLVRGLVTRFVQVELLVGVVGGASAAVLFVLFSYVTAFRLVLYPIVVVVGVLVGIEIPLLLRILKDRAEFKDLVSQILAWDYVGALAASLLFPLVLVPRLGLVRSSLLFGILNVVAGLWFLRMMGADVARAGALRLQGTLALLLLGTGFVFSDQLTQYAESRLYADDVVFAKSTPYQRIVLTRWGDDLRLFLNAHLQFASKDEYRYHEPLVHPGLAALPHAKRVLILGGGDGLAAREVLRYPNVEEVRLVDIDREMTDLFSTHEALVRLNGGSLPSPRLHVTNADAFQWLDQTRDEFDFAIVDFPDPSNYAIGKLYTTAFYRLLGRHLAQDGMAVIQATSPLMARKSFWCIAETGRAAGFQTVPYHCYVPSFGEWGYVMLTRRPYAAPTKYPSGLRFLDAQVAAGMFVFPPDMQAVPAEPNRLDNQVLVRYYESEWSEVGQ